MVRDFLGFFLWSSIESSSEASRSASAISLLTSSSSAFTMPVSFELRFQISFSPVNYSPVGFVTPNVTPLTPVPSPVPRPASRSVFPSAIAGLRTKDCLLGFPIFYCPPASASSSFFLSKSEYSLRISSSFCILSFSEVSLNVEGTTLIVGARPKDFA
jgi:hypothetical protein